MADYSSWASVSESFSWATVFVSTVISSAISAGVTYISSSSLSRATERRVAVASGRQQLVKDVSEISAKARSYWRTSGQDLILERDIIERFHMLFDALGSFYHESKRSKEKDALNALAEQLHMVATGADFESAGRCASPSLVDAIRMAAGRLSDGLKKARP